MKNDKYKTGLENLLKFMIPWELNISKDPFMKTIWQSYNCIESFIIESKYQLFLTKK